MLHTHTFTLAKVVAVLLVTALLGACDILWPDTTPPVITASVSPAANAAGWHTANVTVTFECSDNSGAVATCPDPVLVDTEGDNNVVTGTAVDAAGNTASVSLTVKLDKTPPVVSGYRPGDGDVSPRAEVNLTGKVGDAVSGIATMTCAGSGEPVEAVIETETGTGSDMFGCSLPLNPGPNIITVNGVDFAGNEVTSTLTVNHVPLPRVVIQSPTDGKLIKSASAKVTGTVDDANATLTVNGVATPIVDGKFSAEVPVNNGYNTITAVARNAAGPSSAAIRVLAIVGLKPTVRVLSPDPDFVLGKQHDGKPLAVVVSGWVRDNRLFGIGAAPAIRVWFNNTLVTPSVTKQPQGLCQSTKRCWSYTASMDFDTPEDALSINVEAKTGNLLTRRSRQGVVDFCYVNNGSSSAEAPEACTACIKQRPGHALQSRRCIQNADGCSNPVTPGRKDDPVAGRFGRISTRFGQAEDANTPEGAFTVFGQPRQNQLPCNRHDECYHQWCPIELTRQGVVYEKTVCDVRFYKDMVAVCDKAYPERLCPADRIGLGNCARWRWEKSSCYIWAGIYFDAVAVDTQRYWTLNAYDSWPYNGRFTMCKDCTRVP